MLVMHVCLEAFTFAWLRWIHVWCMLVIHVCLAALNSRLGIVCDSHLLGCVGFTFGACLIMLMIHVFLAALDSRLVHACDSRFLGCVGFTFGPCL